jgi:hypothetical protein
MASSPPQFIPARRRPTSRLCYSHDLPPVSGAQLIGTDSFSLHSSPSPRNTSLRNTGAPRRGAAPVPPATAPARAGRASGRLRASGAQGGRPAPTLSSSTMTRKPIASKPLAVRPSSARAAPRPRRCGRQRALRQARAGAVGGGRGGAARAVAHTPPPSAPPSPQLFTPPSLSLIPGNR